MSNFWQRAITGIVFVAVLASCILWNQWSFLALLAFTSVAATHEFYKLIEKAIPGTRLNKPAGMLSAAVIAWGCFTYSSTGSYPAVFLLIIPLAVYVFIAELYKKSDVPFLNISYTLAGPFYAALPFALLSFLAFRGAGYSYHLVLGFFVLLWTSDTGAYLCGRSFGKHKLFERISPKKTWEGSLGGTILAVLVSIYFAHIYTEISLSDWIISALIVVIFGTLGDLVESMLKRSINVKDSGTILPGHGGLLDRFDGLLLSVPMLVFYFEVLKWLK